MSLTPYQRAVLEQTRLWVQGTCVHSAEPANECCPDFSCCKPEMFIRDQEERRRQYVELQRRYGVTQ